MNGLLTDLRKSEGVTRAESAYCLLEPFFTTSAGGLGLCLSISRSIVERYGGRLWAENNQGRGAVFA